MLKKLKLKFIAITVCIFSVIVLVVISGLYYQNYNQLETRSNYILKRVAQKNSNDVEITIFNPLKNEFAYEHMWAFKINNNNQIIGSQYTITNDSFATILKTLAPNDKGYIVFEQTTFKYEKIGTDIAFVDITFETKRLREVMYHSIILGICAIILVGIFSALLANWALKPVEEAWAKQKQFVSDASHELRTPLTVILANATLLKDNKHDTIENNITQVNYIEDEVRRMSQLVERLLFLAKNDQTKTILHWQNCNLSELLYEVVLPLEALAFEQKKDIELDIFPNVYIQTDIAYMKQLIIILVDNAIKYATMNSTVVIKLNKKGLLSVKNVGPVISKEHIKRLFERFYRIESARQREDVNGYGLGLAIADTIAKWHDTKIQVTSTKEEGTIFAIDFSKKIV